MKIYIQGVLHEIACIVCDSENVEDDRYIIDEMNYACSEECFIEYIEE